MIKRKFMWFLAPDDDAGGGGDDGGPSVADLLGEPDGETVVDGEEGDGEAGDKAKPVKAAPATVDADALATKFGDVIGKHFAKVSAQNEPEPPKLTPEQARAALQLFEPDDNFLKEFGDLATQKKAFEKFRDAQLRTTYLMLEAQKADFQKTLDGRFTPIQSMLETQHRQAMVAQFDSSYPQLADPELRPLLESVAKTLEGGKKFGNDPAANFRLIAEGAARVIAKNAPDFKLEPNSSATKKPATPRPGGIPVVTQGGGGGGGSTRQAAEPGTSKLVQLLGKVGG